jgi:hypothetical protein
MDVWAESHAKEKRKASDLSDRHNPSAPVIFSTQFLHLAKTQIKILFVDDRIDTHLHVCCFFIFKHVLELFGQDVCFLFLLLFVFRGL